uniref:Uncharacterized protein n=1 Tax=Ditylenchus dipsaci TaxID=166011 RepID=A0A915DGM6_9BILA
MQAEFLPVPTRATWLGNAERFLERSPIMLVPSFTITRSMKPVTDIQTRISNVGDKSPTEESSHSVGSAKRLATLSFRSLSNYWLLWKKIKKRNSSLALEISALLDEVGKQSGPHSLLVCKRDFRDVINSWEECLANEIYINNTQVLIRKNQSKKIHLVRIEIIVGHLTMY